MPPSVTLIDHDLLLLVLLASLVQSDDCGQSVVGWLVGHSIASLFWAAFLLCRLVHKIRLLFAIATTRNIVVHDINIITVVIGSLNGWGSTAFNGLGSGQTIKEYRSIVESHTNKHTAR